VFSGPPPGPDSVNALASARVTAIDEPALVPIAFVAVTSQVYGVPLVKPATVIGLLEPLPVCPPQVTV
jgi:hypothetical protein